MNSAFTIYSWPAGFPETVSGSGSTLSNTANIRANLPTLITELGVKSVWDAPCGDRNWIKTINFEAMGVKYAGGDIIPELTQDPEVTEFNLITDVFPDADLWICRDCLYHLPLADITKIINNAIQSDIPWFLITSHAEKHSADIRNRDISAGSYRCLILSEHDYFGLGEPVLRLPDCAVNLTEEMLLFRNPRINHA
jgi:hypothetical protein